jgi:sugar/nucleoside kinase (ribokinase family)
VGVAGRSPVANVSVQRQCDELGIDHTMVRQDEARLGGACFALTEDGERTLLVHPGANEYMADYLAGDFTKVVDYLASAAVVHVTSFLDERTPDRLLAILRAVKAASPETRISFDPGYVWCVTPPPAIDGLLRLADYVLPNYTEFGQLGGSGADHLTAEALLRRCASPDAAVIVKRPNGIWNYRRAGDELAADFYEHTTLASSAIKDATAAGDVFAAGLLSILARDRGNTEHGARLGLRLAKHKLQHVGTTGHNQFAELARGPIQAQQAG